jgi:hypothetical protein
MSTSGPEQHGAHSAEDDSDVSDDSGDENHIDPAPLAIGPDDINDFIDRYPTDDDDDDGPDIRTQVQPPL